MRISTSLAEGTDPGSWPGMTENCPGRLKTTLFTHQISLQPNKYGRKQLLKK
jgi:hypothetical protein